MQCNAVQTVGQLENVTEHKCVLRDLALDGCFHCFGGCQRVGNRTDTTDTGCDLGHLLRGLSDGEFFNSPHRGNGTPVTRLDDACVVNLQDQSWSVPHVLWLGKSLQLSTILSPHYYVELFI